MDRASAGDRPCVAITATFAAASRPAVHARRRSRCVPAKDRRVQPAPRPRPRGSCPRRSRAAAGQGRACSARARPRLQAVIPGEGRDRPSVSASSCQRQRSSATPARGKMGTSEVPGQEAPELGSPFREVHQVAGRASRRSRPGEAATAAAEGVWREPQTGDRATARPHTAADGRDGRGQAGCISCSARTGSSSAAA